MYSTTIFCASFSIVLLKYNIKFHLGTCRWPFLSSCRQILQHGRKSVPQGLQIVSQSEEVCRAKKENPAEKRNSSRKRRQNPIQGIFKTNNNILFASFHMRFKRTKISLIFYRTMVYMYPVYVWRAIAKYLICRKLLI